MKKILAIFVIMACQQAFAGDCEMTFDRKPCPGKEVEMLKPYDGKNPTVTKISTADQAACEKTAEKKSKIIRKGTLEKKEVTVKYDGKALDHAFTDHSECK